MDTVTLSENSERPIPHGTASGYNNHKCRCQPCRDAWAASMRDYQCRRAERENPRVQGVPITGLACSQCGLGELRWRPGGVVQCAMCRYESQTNLRAMPQPHEEWVRRFAGEAQR